MIPVILYRGGRECMDEEELEAATSHFHCVTSRMAVGRDWLVIGRYSVLPFYRELEQDIRSIGSRLINTHEQHLYVADLQNWVADLGALTPATWNRLEDIRGTTGPFVLKGATNSKKFQWKTHMFARDWLDAGTVYDRLCEDGLIAQQHIYIRQYLPLTTYFEDVVGLPVTKEFRFFVYEGEILTGGYYWSSHIDALREQGIDPKPEEVPKEFLAEVLRRVGKKVAFYALDVAELSDGRWIVIELNDGQMSGLSMNDPKVLYARLAERLK